MFTDVGLMVGKSVARLIVAAGMMFRGDGQAGRLTGATIVRFATLAAALVLLAVWVAASAGAGEVRYRRLLLDEARDVLYVAGTVDGTPVLDVVDPDTRAVVDRLDLPYAAHDMALSPGGDQLALAHFETRAISLVDPSTFELTTTLPAPAEPRWLAFGRPGRLYASTAEEGDANKQMIAVFDTISPTLVSTTTLGLTEIYGDGARLALANDGADLYVTAGGGNVTLYRMNALSDTLPILAEQDYNGFNSLDVASDGSRVFTQQGIWAGDLSRLLADFEYDDAELVDELLYVPELERVYLNVMGALVVHDAFSGAEVDRFSDVWPWSMAASPSRERIYYIKMPEGEIATVSWRHYPAFLPAVNRPYELVYGDDFSDPASGWVVGDAEFGRLSYQEGEYELLLRQQSSWVGIVNPVELEISNYRLQATLRQATATDSIHGIIFDWQSWDYYSVLVLESLAGEVAIYYHNYDTWEPLLPFTPHPAAAVGTNPYDVRIERVGSRLLAWIDGTKIADVTTPQRYSMRAGFYLESGTQVPAILRADSLAIYRLPWDYRPGEVSPPPVSPRPLTGPLWAFGEGGVPE